MPIEKKTPLKAMTIQELYYYNSIVKQQIDNALVRLRMQLPENEYRNINEKRLKYNHIWDALQEEINKRIFSIEIS